MITYFFRYILQACTCNTSTQVCTRGRTSCRGVYESRNSDPNLGEFSRPEASGTSMKAWFLVRAAGKVHAIAQPMMLAAL